MTPLVQDTLTQRAVKHVSPTKDGIHPTEVCVWTWGFGLWTPGRGSAVFMKGLQSVTKSRKPIINLQYKKLNATNSDPYVKKG